MRHALWGLVLAACSSELPPTGQVLLHVTTDAPLPSTRDGSGGLFDRLLIDVFPPGASAPCTGCTRSFAVDHDLVDRGDASVGVVAEPGQRGTRVRVRLYREGGTISAMPRPGSTLEAVIALPEVQDEGIVHVTVELPVTSLGQPNGTLEAPSPARQGTPAGGLVGSWPGAHTVPCTATVPDDMACVPGSAFWMGDPRLDLSATDDMDGALERLVVVSPFLLDRAEVTVAAFRASGLAQSLVPNGPSDNPHEAGGDIVGCTYTTPPSDNDPLPVNCVSWELAAAYCAALGKTLPTEAQLELVQSGLGAHRYPWGEDEPRCDDAVFAREDHCNALGEGPAVAGSGTRDRLVVGGAELVDLAGNVMEWTADLWNRETEACWGLGLRVDPLCAEASTIDPAGRTVRGGHFDALEVSLQAAVRRRVFNQERAVSELVGFRCAAPAL